jgi:hypothetical protein
MGSGFVAETIRAMDEGFMARNDAALALAHPNLSAKDRRKYALVCIVEGADWSRASPVS